MLSGKNRKDIVIGAEVEIVEKQNQRTGILTKSKHHPHGIKVQLETGEIGRIQKIITS